MVVEHKARIPSCSYERKSSGFHSTIFFLASLSRTRAGPSWCCPSVRPVHQMFPSEKKPSCQSHLLSPHTVPVCWCRICSFHSSLTLFVLSHTSFASSTLLLSLVLFLSLPVSVLKKTVFLFSSLLVLSGTVVIAPGWPLKNVSPFEFVDVSVASCFLQIGLLAQSTTLLLSHPYSLSLSSSPMSQPTVHSIHNVP